MNALAKIPKASAPVKGANSQPNVRAVLTDLLELERERVRCMKLCTGYRKLAGHEWKEAPHHIETARAIAARLAPPFDPRKQWIAFGVGHREPVAEAQLDLLIAILLDGYPNAKPGRRGYVDALALTVMEENADTTPAHFYDPRSRISAPAVAAAIKALWAAKEFPPSASEFLAACIEARDRFNQASKACHDADDQRDCAEMVLVAAGELHEFSNGEPVDEFLEEVAAHRAEQAVKEAERAAKAEAERIEAERREAERIAAEEAAAERLGEARLQLMTECREIEDKDPELASALTQAVRDA